MRTFDDSNILETPVSCQRVFDGIILHIDHQMNRLPNGAVKPREIARHIGAAAVVPVDSEGNVWLVRQYRACVDQVLLEIPAGKLDAPGEDRRDAAERELSEETGCTAAKWTHLTDIYTSCGFTDEKIGLYLAEGLSFGDTHPDEDEFLNIVKLPLAEAVQMVRNGEIPDSKTICALLLAETLVGK